VLEQLDSLLSDLLPAQPIEFRGEWLTTTRRTYESRAQTGTGSGPVADVLDFRWQGALSSAVAISGIAFLLTSRAAHWVKAAKADMTLAVEVSFHACDGFRPEGATFTASLADAHLPGVPVRGARDPAAGCTLGSGTLTTGRVTCLARTDEAAFLVLPLQRDLLKFGRSHLWRLRDEVAVSLPPEIRELLTRRRTGVIPRQAPPATGI